MNKIKLIFHSTIIFLASLITTSPIFAQSDVESPPQNVKEFAESQFETAKKLVELLIEFFVKYSFQALGGIIVLILGWFVARFVTKFVADFLKSKEIDVTVSKFMVGAAKLLIMAFAVIVALGKFGIEIAPLIAGVSVIGFATSFALQGPLSNYAAGAILIFTKPFKVNDIIEVAGVMGEVLDMQLSRTLLKTVDGNMVVIPNKHIVGEVIHNFSGFKRLDITVGVSYKSDIQKAIDIIKDVIKNDAKVCQDYPPKVGISEFADSSINVHARIWCKQNDYWDVLFGINKSIWDAFNKNGIEIPFPQRDLHIHKDL